MSYLNLVDDGRIGSATRAKMLDADSDLNAAAFGLLPVPLVAISLQGYNSPNYLNGGLLKLFSKISEIFADFSSGTTGNSGSMGWDPTICGPSHNFLLAMHSLAIAPNKADCPAERTARFQLFSYPFGGNEEVRVRQWADHAPASGKTKSPLGGCANSSAKWNCSTASGMGQGVVTVD